MLNLDQAKAAARSRWTLPVVLVVVALVMAWRLDAGRRAQGEAARLAEAEQLRQRGVAAAAQERARGLERALREAVAASEDLGAELARVRVAAPGARPVLVAKGSTGPVKAGGLPRALEGRGLAAQGEEQAGGAGPQSHDPPAAESPPSPACLLAEGDEGEIRTAVAGLETRAGNLVVVGAAEAWRLTPPATRLFGGPLRLEATVEERADSGPGWGGGARVQAGRRGVLVGPALSPPPWRVWRYQLEIQADAVLELSTPAPGAGREWAVGASVLGRRWR